MARGLLHHIHRHQQHIHRRNTITVMGHGSRLLQSFWTIPTRHFTPIRRVHHHQHIRLGPGSEREGARAGLATRRSPSLAFDQDYLWSVVRDFLHPSLTSCRRCQSSRGERGTGPSRIGRNEIRTTAYNGRTGKLAERNRNVASKTGRPRHEGYMTLMMG